MILLIIGVVPALVISLGGIWVIWRLEGKTTQALESATDLALRTLTTTEQVLTLGASSLNEVQDNLILIRSSADEISTALSTTVNVTGQIGTLVGEELIGVIESTQSSLKTMQSSAQLIDQTLTVITALPFIGNRYAPKVPLEKSIGEVNSNLDNIPDTLMQIQAELQATSKSLSALQEDVQKLGTELESVEENLKSAHQSVTEYQRIADEAISQLTAIRSAIASWVRAFAIGLTILCLWILLTQLALLIQVLVNKPSKVTEESPQHS